MHRKIAIFNNRDEFLYDFVQAKPGIYDFENELKKFNLIEAELESETNEFRYLLSNHFI